MFTTACFPLSPTAVVAEMPEAEHEGIGGDCLTCGTSQEVRKAQHLEGGSTGLQVRYRILVNTDLGFVQGSLRTLKSFLEQCQ